MVNTNDLYCDAQPHGMRWLAVFRLPWRPKAQFVQKNGERVLFDNECDALRAASRALLLRFRNNTTGWYEDPASDAKAEAEALFKSEGKNG
ncbi:MAG: hypothetical protein AAF468_20075 [Pseudomonadota bacterium]